ncbi:hypothetical protein ACB092_05G279000 [Castanea dentata]
MMLSRAGKEVLIKAVTQSIPTYAMGLNSMKIHRRSWDKLTAAKKEDGIGFRDLRTFNLTMLAKQGWRLMQEKESLFYKCFSARYFPRSHFLDAVESPNCSYVWTSIMAALPILKVGCYWRVGDGSTIKIQSNKWLPNYPTNRVLHSANAEVEDWLVSNLIDQQLHWRRRDLITTIFHREDVDAIWYHVARQVLKHEGWAESSKGSDMQKVWQALWKLRVPNKIKIFGWRVFHGILPTGRACPICTRFLETEIHVLLECLAAQDVWVGSRIKLQKCHLGQHDMVQLFQYLLDRLDIEEVELFLVQAWVVWNQRNNVLHGGKLKETFCRPDGSVWRPPSQSLFTLNFDAAIFKEHNSFGFGAVIWNKQGEVMAAMAAKGPLVFAVRRLRHWLSSSTMNFSTLGNVIADIHCLLCGLGRVSISCIKRGENRVAHELAKYARLLDDDMYWMEEVPQVAVEDMYQDSFLMYT